MSKCRFCGTSNPPGTETCPGCGATILDDDGPATPTQPTADHDSDRSGEPTDGVESRILAELQAGRKISAIKIYREMTGMGLKEAKEAVEELARRHGIAATRTGCAGVLLLIVVTSAVLVAAF